MLLCLIWFVWIDVYLLLLLDLVCCLGFGLCTVCLIGGCDGYVVLGVLGFVGF